MLGIALHYHISIYFHICAYICICLHIFAVFGSFVFGVVSSSRRQCSPGFVRAKWLAIVQSQAEVPGLVFVAKGFGNLAARCRSMQ